METKDNMRRRKIVAITMVKNEMDIIESFVRHTLGFADLLIAADHKSTDRTREILESLREEGLPLEIEEIHTVRYAQADVMTMLLHRAADLYDADLILPLDADEFLVPTGQKTVREVLDDVPTDRTMHFLMRNYVPQDAKGIPSNTFLLAAPLFRTKEQSIGKKVLVSGSMVRSERAGLSGGNHTVIRRTERGGWKEQGDSCEGVEIAHFALRSPEQIRSKFVVGWMNIVAQYSRETPLGGHYRNIVAEICKGILPARMDGNTSWVDCDLHGRVPMTTLRYSADTMPDAFLNLMAASEALAQEFAETRALSAHPWVTTIVPYLGGGGQTSFGEERFRKTISSAQMEDYPWHEILVLVVSGELPAAFASEIVAEGAAIVAPEELVSSVKGDFVEILFPGETVHMEKLRRMVASAVLQNAYPLWLCGSEKSGQGFPCYDFNVLAAENVRVVSCKSVQRQALLNGTYPCTGLSGIFMWKEVFSACRNVFRCWRDGYPHTLSIWYALLSAGARFDGLMVILHDAFAGASPTLSLEEIAAHHLDWRMLCMQHEEALDAAQREDILLRQRQLGIEVLERALSEGCDMQSGIWPAYQEMLQRL